MDSAAYQKAEKMFEGIRDERGLRANTATRIGTAFLELLYLFKDSKGDIDQASIKEFLNSPTFNEGLMALGAIYLGQFVAGASGGKLDENGDAEFNNITVRNNASIINIINSPTFKEGLKALGEVLFGEYKEGEEGGKIDQNGDAEFRNIVIRGNTNISNITGTPTFKEGLRSLGAIIIGEYVSGLSGGIINVDGSSELESLLIRSGLTTSDLNVLKDSSFNGNLSSPDFISSFFGGLGWAIQKKEIENAAGEIETKYTLEIDNITVRGAMRVYELIISQLLGENGNRFFSDMMEVDHYDSTTGKIWLKTHNGKLYNPFRIGDLIIVQQYNGNPSAENNWYVTKSYELRITAVGIGEQEGSERLDWVRFEKFSSTDDSITPETAISEGDTLVRCDNDLDPNRRGLITMMTVGENTPYMDIIYGMKTDPNNSLKGRFGKLEGIITDIFGSLDGFGVYLNNLYAVGKFFNAQTGESLTARIESTRSRMRSIYSETIYNISDDDNFLLNGFFQKDLEGWSKCNVDGTTPEEDSDNNILAVDSLPVMFNGTPISVSSKKGVKIKELEGVRVLHLMNMGVSQDFSEIRANGTHKVMSSLDSGNTDTNDVPDTLYMGIRILPVTSGKLQVTFLKEDGTSTGWYHDVESNANWITIQKQDYVELPWDYTGTGKMIVSYTGECCVKFVALQSDAIENSRIDYSTLFEQTSRKITLQATKQSGDLQEAIAQFTIEAENIRSIVTNNKKAADEAIENRRKELEDYIASNDAVVGSHTTWIDQTSKWVDIVAANWNVDGTLKDESSIVVFGDSIVESAKNYTNGQLTNYSTTTQTAESITNAVKDLAKASDVEALDTKISDDISTINSNITKLNNDLAAESDQNDQRASALATWQTQTSESIAAIAGKWDSDGNLIGYSTTSQTATSISNAVKDLAKASDVEALDTQISGDISTINSNITKLTNDLAAESDQNDQRASALATWQTQTSDRIDAIAGKWDEDGNLIGYSTTSQTANLILTTVRSNGYITENDLETELSYYSTTVQTSSLIQSTVQKESKTNLISTTSGWWGPFNKEDDISYYVETGKIVSDNSLYSPLFKMEKGVCYCCMAYFPEEPSQSDCIYATTKSVSDAWECESEYEQMYPTHQWEYAGSKIRVDDKVYYLYYCTFEDFYNDYTATLYLEEDIFHPYIFVGSHPSQAVSIQSVISQTADEIDIGIRNGLSNTGINITTGVIELKGDQVVFENTDGTVSRKIWIDPTSGTLHAVDGHFSGTLNANLMFSKTTVIDDEDHVIDFSTDSSFFFIRTNAFDPAVITLPDPSDYDGLEVQFYSSHNGARNAGTAYVECSSSILYRDETETLPLLKATTKLWLPANEMVTIKAVNGMGWYSDEMYWVVISGTVTDASNS